MASLFGVRTGHFRRTHLRGWWDPSASAAVRPLAGSRQTGRPEKRAARSYRPIARGALGRHPSFTGLRCGMGGDTRRAPDPCELAARAKNEATTPRRFRVSARKRHARYRILVKIGGNGFDRSGAKPALFRSWTAGRSFMGGSAPGTRKKWTEFGIGDLSAMCVSSRHRRKNRRAVLSIAFSKRD